MKPDIIVPVSLFFSIAWAIKSVVDARMRGRLLSADRTDDLIRMMVLSDERQRRNSSLRWGIVLTCVAIGFGLIQILGFEEVSAGVAAILLGATGVGNIVSHVVAGTLESRQPPEE